MKQTRFKDGKKNRLPGEETLRRAKAQGRQQRHNSIRSAIMEMGNEDEGFNDVWLALDGYRFLLTHDENKAIKSYSSQIELIRTKRFGLRIAEVSYHNEGSAILMNKETVIGLRRNQTLAYVAVVQTKDGTTVAWNFGTGSPDALPQYGKPETT